MTVHLVTSPGVNAETDVLPAVRGMLAKDFGITHITVQCELKPCHQTDEADHFKSAPAEVAEEHDHVHGAAEARGREDA